MVSDPSPYCSATVIVMSPHFPVTVSVMSQRNDLERGEKGEFGVDSPPFLWFSLSSPDCCAIKKVSKR